MVVDDLLPLEKVQQPDWTFAWETMFAHIGEGSSMWGPILEKAFAKLHGNYHHIIEGNPREATLSLTGSPSLYQVHENFTADQIWSQLVKHDANNEMIFFNTPIFPDGAETNACGLTTGHAYVVLSAK